MKRLLSILLVAATILCLLPMQALAAEKEIAYYPDGSYTTTEIIRLGSRASGSTSGSKVKNHYDSDGNLKWKATLTGSFTYTGFSATCTSSSISTTIYDSTWSTGSKSSSKSGSTAKGSVTMNRKLNGVTAKSVTTNLSLTCSANGKLS